MSFLDQFIRLSRGQRCPVCGHDSWCMIHTHRPAMLCARVPSPRRIGEAGWLHGDAGGDEKRDNSAEFTIDINDSMGRRADVSDQLVNFHRAAADDGATRWLAAQLGVSVRSLLRLELHFPCEPQQGINPTWLPSYFVFPMRSWSGQYITGLRTRFLTGEKRSIAGSKQALFIPSDLHGQDPLLIVEGPTDCAAALDLGFDAIGRPSATLGEKDVWHYVNRHHLRRPVIIIADIEPSGVGVRGAVQLRKALRNFVKPMPPELKIITPPQGIKDLRDWVRAGCTAQHVLNAPDRAGELYRALKAAA